VRGDVGVTGCHRSNLLCVADIPVTTTEAEEHQQLCNMEASYREKLGKLTFTDEEIGLVVKSTATLLRRHCNDGTLCPRCGNDDTDALTVTKIDRLGFITEVK